MKLTIDTEADSPEDIRKAIELLHSIIHHKEPAREEFSLPSQPAENVGELMNLFDSESKQEPPEQAPEPHDSPSVEFY